MTPRTRSRLIIAIFIILVAAGAYYILRPANGPTQMEKSPPKAGLLSTTKPTATSTPTADITFNVSPRWKATPTPTKP